MAARSHLVEIGQLVAGRVDADVVGIAPQGEHRIARPRDRRPRRHGRAFGVLRRGVLVGEQLGPGLEARRLCRLVDVLLGGVRRVELLEVVRRQEHREGAVGAVLVGDGGEEQGRRRGVGEAHRGVVDLLDLGGRAVGVLDPARQAGRQLLVQEHVVVPEQDVGGGEGLAVRPLRALAQLDRPGLEVGRGLGAFGDLGLDLGAVGREAEQRVVDHADIVVGVGRAEEGAAPHAAILADPLDHRHHQRLLGQAGVDGRQLAGLDLLGQDGRFLVAPALCQGAVARQQTASRQPDQRQTPIYGAIHGRSPCFVCCREPQSDSRWSQGIALHSRLRPLRQSCHPERSEGPLLLP